MKNVLNKYRFHGKDRGFLVSAANSFLLLIFSLVLNFYAGTYATEQASNPVSDIVLSNIRVYEVGWFFVYGAIFFWIFIALLCIYEPKRIPYTLKSIALFILVRSVFVSLTHLGPFPTQAPYNTDILSKFTFGADLFFSGHTGLPFLMALVFWQDIYLRILFIVSAVFFGAVVLMGHLHYSIDVLSAFFITYSISRIAEVFFKKDHVLFDANPNPVL